MNANPERLLRVVIVDDEAPARNRLRDLLVDCAAKVPLEVVGEAATGREALELLQGQDADLVLLDIRMPEMEGVELAEHLLKLNDPPAVIFITAYHEYAVKAFELNAIDYLLKPIRASRLAEALAKARAIAPLRAELLRGLAEAPRQHVSVTEGGRVYLVPLADIIYFKAELKYVTIRIAQREYLIEESLTRLEQEFAARFVRIHRNCLVAREAITGFERMSGADVDAHWVVMLKGLAEKLPISRRQQHIVRELAR
ncbi:MAG: response regulator transcription factor [Proteobacteria bacterium]|nr:response regulator transcription factor [Burkholderiales bacterium]